MSDELTPLSPGAGASGSRLMNASTSQPPTPLPAPHSILPYAGEMPAMPSSWIWKVQRVLENVVGRNLRIQDNVIQLACVAVGGGIGALEGSLILMRSGPILGLSVGALVALLLSRTVIGVIRGRGAKQQEPHH